MDFARASRTVASTAWAVSGNCPPPEALRNHNPLGHLLAAATRPAFRPRGLRGKLPLPFGVGGGAAGGNG